MPTFSFPDDFKDHKEYVKLLKKALLVVKPGAEKKFLYFKQYPFGAKKLQLVLVDFDLNCATALTKAGHKTTAEGIVTLTEKEELNFDAKKGSLKRIKIKRYFGTLGPGIKEVFVPPGEVDEEEEGGVSTEGQNLVPPGQPAPRPPGQPSQPAPTPPMGKQMERKMEFEENEFKRRQLLARIEELRGNPLPPGMDPKKKDEILEKAKSLAGANNFADATILLDVLAAKFAAPTPPGASPKPPEQPAPAPPKPKPPSYPAPAPPKPFAPAPTLSAYMNATGQWKVAKTAAEDGVFRLKTAIMQACDPELKKEVEAKINQLNSILAVMDDTIVKKIDEARSDGDEERRAERDVAIGKLASSQLEVLRKHPLANVVDNNPFGTFAIRNPMEAFLTKIATTFGG